MSSSLPPPPREDRRGSAPGGPALLLCNQTRACSASVVQSQLQGRASTGQAVWQCRHHMAGQRTSREPRSGLRAPWTCSGSLWGAREESPWHRGRSPPTPQRTSPACVGQRRCFESGRLLRYGQSGKCLPYALAGAGRRCRELLLADSGPGGSDLAAPGVPGRRVSRKARRGRVPEPWRCTTSWAGGGVRDRTAALCPAAAAGICPPELIGRPATRVSEGGTVACVAEKPSGRERLKTSKTDHRNSVNTSVIYGP